MFEPSVELYANNDADFRTVYNHTMPILFRVAFRIAGSEEAAEDLCHDALIKMTEKDMRFPSINDAKYWLIRVVKNASLNYAKRKTREKRAYERALKEDRRTIDSGETELMKGDAIQRVQAALDKLPEKLRVVLQLKEYGEMNYKEIGLVLGITEGNVKVRVFRAREQLSRLIGEEDVYLP